MSKRTNRQKDRRQTRRRMKDSPVKQIGTRKLMKMHYGDGPSRVHAAERNTDKETNGDDTND
jgi:hypothetical protein